MDQCRVVAVMFLVVGGGDLLSILEAECCGLLERGQPNRLCFAIYGLPRPGVKGELLEELQLATLESATGVGT